MEEEGSVGRKEKEGKERDSGKTGRECMVGKREEGRKRQTEE